MRESHTKHRPVKYEQHKWIAIVLNFRRTKKPVQAEQVTAKTTYVQLPTRRLQIKLCSLRVCVSNTRELGDKLISVLFVRHFEFAQRE